MFSWIREGFADPTKSTFNDLKTYFTDTLPNAIYTTDKTINLKAISGTHNIMTNTLSTPLKQEYVKDVGNLGAAFNKQQASCEIIGSGDKFDMLTSMASSIDTSQKMRCGWVYNTANFERSNGALGTVDGPIKTDTKGQWMWNLPAAKQRYHTDICKRVQACEDIDASQYKQRCGWCSTSGKAVPVIGSSVAYPVGTATSCSPNSLITSSAKCPKPQPVPADSTYVRTPAEVCTPLQNGALPRNCLLQKVTSAGCSDEGSLYQSLKGSSDNDYLSAVYNKKAYTTYQERALVPLNNTAVKTGKLTSAEALNEFKRIQDQSASDANTGLRFAARDLCMKSGIMDQFDFCSELQDSTTGPFTLDCLKKAFLRSGGQVTGEMCPSQSNMQKWNSLGTWGNVRKQIRELKDNTKSTTRKIQAEAMMNFYGIKLGSGSATLPGIANVGFVRIEGTGSSSYLNMSQLVVFDENGKNVSVKRPVQSSALGWGTVGSTANDGNERPRPHPNEIHGMGSGKDFWQVQLDRPTTVTSVVVYNRSDCCGDRMGSGFVIKLFTANPNPLLLWTSEPLNDSQVQRIMTPGGIYTPRTAPLDHLQNMFTSAGCTRQLTESDVGWWRTTGSLEGIQNDMNAYGSLTKSCQGDKRQTDFCKPGNNPCPYNAETQKCIQAVEQTGFVPRITWGSTPPSQHNSTCDDLLCPYFKNKYGSYDKVPATYSAAVAWCKSKGL